MGDDVTAPVITELAVTVDGWTASMGSAGFRDDNECEWILTELDGWFGDVDVRSAPIDSDTTDGTIDGLTTRGARIVTVGGSVRAPDRGSLMAAMDSLAGVLAGRSRVGTLVVNEEARGLSRQAAVRLDSATKIKIADRLRAEWSVVLYAPDPVRYGVDLREASTVRYVPGGLFHVPIHVPIHFGPPGSAGFLNIYNVGNQDVWPVLRMQGPLVNPSVRLVGGAALTAYITLNVGEQLIIDTKAHTVMLGQSSRRGFLSFDSQWYSVPPGSSQLFFSADSGAGTMTAQWRDAWA